MNRILKLSFKSQHNENNAPKNSLKLPFYLKLKTLHAVYSPSFSWGRRGYWGRPQKRRAGLALFIATTEGGFNDQVRFRLRWFYSLWNGTSLFFSLLFFSFFSNLTGSWGYLEIFPIRPKAPNEKYNWKVFFHFEKRRGKNVLLERRKQSGNITSSSNSAYKGR